MAPVEGCNDVLDDDPLVPGIDTDSDEIADVCDDCPDIADPFQNDYDEDGLADACDDDDDDGDDLKDCWNYWYDDGIHNSLLGCIIQCTCSFIKKNNFFITV